MKYLLDTSAIITIVQEKGRDAMDFLKGHYTLDLAYYECGNAIRTIFHRKLVSRAEALQLASDISGAWMLLHVIPLTITEMQETLGTALDEEIAFYDAAFLLQARKQGFAVVTDDKPFQKKIPLAITSLDSAQFLARNA